MNDNGLNPIWNKEFTFILSTPSLAILYFNVMDKDELNGDDFIAYAALPILTIKQGYRRVPLYSKQGCRNGDFKYASLLCITCVCL